MELLSYFTGFAFVAINRIPQADRIAVVHEAGVRSKSPEWSGSDLVPLFPLAGYRSGLRIIVPGSAYLVCSAFRHWSASISLPTA